MNITGLVQQVITKPVPIRSGRNAGTTGYVRSAVIDGRKINFGFKKAPEEGTAWTGEITDAPNRFGEHEVVSHGPSSGTGSTVVSSVHGNPVSSVATKSTSQSNTGRAAFPIPKTDHATSICRQSALKAAVDCLPYLFGTGLVAETETLADATLELAEHFAKWTTGQAEVEEAERIIKNSTHVEGE